MLRRASWDEALSRAAEGFRRTREAYGPDAFAMLSCARATNEMNYVAQKFTRVVMGTNNVDSCNRTCHAPSVAGLSAAFGSGGGTSSYEEVEHTDLIVMWGSNARFAHPIFFQHVLKGIRNGARMHVVDPAARRPPSGRRAGSASTSAPTYRWRTPSAGRSSTPGWSTVPSWTVRPAATRSTRPSSNPGP